MSTLSAHVTMTRDFLDARKGDRQSVPVEAARTLVEMGVATTGRPEADALIRQTPKAVDRAMPRASFADFLHAVRRRDAKYLVDHYGSKFVLANESDGDSVAMHQHRKTALAESSGATGGYTVPEEFTSRIMGEVAEFAVLRTLVDNVGGLFPMSTATLSVPTPDVTTVQATGVSPFFGGTHWNWTAEGQTRVQTAPQFKQTELKAWELSGYVTISRPLADDSPALARYLYRQFVQGIAWYEDYAFLQGNGVGMPQGIVNANASVPVVRQNADSIQYADIVGMMATLPPGSLDQAHWLASPSTLTNLFQLRDGTNRAVEFHATQQPVGKKREYVLAGLPLHTTEKCSPLGTKGDLLLIDPRYYVVGEHDTMLISVSEHVKLLTNQLVYRVVRRVDGQSLFGAPITLQDGVTTVSGLVVLD